MIFRDFHESEFTWEKNITINNYNVDKKKINKNRIQKELEFISIIS